MTKVDVSDGSSVISTRTWTESKFENKHMVPHLNDSDEIWLEYIKLRNVTFPHGDLAKATDDVEDTIEEAKKFFYSSHASNSDGSITCETQSVISTCGSEVIRVVQLTKELHGAFKDVIRQKPITQKVVIEPISERSMTKGIASRPPLHTREHANEPVYQSFPHRQSPRKYSDERQIVLRGKRKRDESDRNMQMITAYDAQQAAKRVKRAPHPAPDVFKPSPIDCTKRVAAHLNALGAHLNNLRCRDQCCDIHLLTSDDVVVLAHSTVLSSVSFFRNIIKERRSERRQEDLTIAVNADKKTLCIVLDYIYTGVCHIARNNVFDILNNSCIMKVRTLSTLCVEFIIDNRIISPHNCLDVLRVAESYYESDTPYNKAMKTLKEHILGTLWRNPDFLNALFALNIDGVLTLSCEIFETLVFRCGTLFQHKMDNIQKMFDVVKKWLDKFEERNLGMQTRNYFSLLSTLSQRLLESPEYRKWTLNISIDRKNIEWYKCEVNCRGTLVDLECRVNEIDGEQYLGLVARLKHNDVEVPPSWYHCLGLGYTLVSEGCVFACEEDQNVFFGNKIKEKFVGFDSIIALNKLYDESAGYLSQDGKFRFQVHVDPDHVSGFLVHYIVRHFDAVWKENSESILCLEIELLTFILQQDKLNVREEGTVLDVICYWLTDEYLDLDLFREEDIVKLMNCVRWQYISLKDMTSAMEIIENTKNPGSLKSFRNIAGNIQSAHYAPRSHYDSEVVIATQNWHTLMNSSHITPKMWDNMLDTVSKIHAEFINKPYQTSLEELIERLKQENLRKIDLEKIARFVLNIMNYSQQERIPSTGINN